MTVVLEPHGIACTLGAQLAVAPGTLLQLDIATDSLQSAATDGGLTVGDSPLMLHVARQKEQGKWTPVLKAKVRSWQARSSAGMQQAASLGY